MDDRRAVDTFDTPRGCAFLYDGGTGTLCGRPERDSVHRAPSNDEDSNLYHAFVSLKATNATLCALGEPYFTDGQVSLYLADSLAVELPEADLIVTDPPYGVTSLKWDRWAAGWAAKARGASMWCFGSLRMFMDHADEFASAGWQQSHNIVWEKHNGSGFHADRFRCVHEHAVHFYRGEWANVYREPQYTNTASKKTVRSKRRPTHTGSIERTPYRTLDGGPQLATSVMFAASMHGKALHPTEKPVEILVPLIKYGCKPNGLVVDLFAGAGSTLAAARIAGCRAIGFEINEVYAERAARRLAQGELFAS